jgi:hypothetical protein
MLPSLHNDIQCTSLCSFTWSILYIVFQWSTICCLILILHLMLLGNHWPTGIFPMLRFVRICPSSKRYRTHDLSITRHACYRYATRWCLNPYLLQTWMSYSQMAGMTMIRIRRCSINQSLPLWWFWYWQWQNSMRDMHLFYIWGHFDTLFGIYSMQTGKGFTVEYITF